MFLPSTPGGRQAQCLPFLFNRQPKHLLTGETLTGKPMTSKTISLRRCAWIATVMTAVGMVAGAQMDSRATTFMRIMDEGMKRMDANMNSAPMNGNSDHDFAAMMMPHHQGAIDMAKAELIYGKDPVMKRLAEEIIVDQQSEIQAMQLWLSKQTAQSSKVEK
jgi:hypothetical protein